MKHVIKAIFTKNGGEPADDILPVPKINQIIKLSDGSIILSNADMVNRGGGAYIYDFTSLFDKNEDYHIVIDSGDRSLDGKGWAYGGNDLFTNEFIEDIAITVKDTIGEVYGGFPG